MPNINSLTYNGMKSTDLGVYVTGSGSFDAAEMDADKYEIAGRNGDLIIPKNRYKNIVVTYPAFIPKAFQEKAQSIRNWMRSAKAYARLEDTYDMEHYRLGLASGIQSFEPVNRNDASNFQINFDCKPQRFLKTGETESRVNPSVGTEDKVPYLFKAVEHDGRDSETDMLVGGTIAWNQLLQNGNFANGTTGWSGASASLAVTDGVAKVTFTGSAWNNDLRQNSAPVIANHVYLFHSFNRASSAMNLTYRGLSGQNALRQFSVTTSWGEFGSMFKPTTVTQNGLGITLNGNGSSLSGEWFETKNFNCFDLTQMFGSTIADYIYSLEQSTAGAGVAWFRKLFPKPCYAYNAGTLLSVNASKHKMVGFNAWDEVAEEGGISTSTGQNITSAGNSRTKNYIPVVPNTKYYFKSPVTLGLRFYDASKNIIGDYALSANNSYTMPNDCHFLRFVIVGVTAYANNICVSLYWDGERAGEYEEYKTWEYPLDSDLELRGIPKLSAANELYYDGDTYESDGTVTRNTILRAYQSGDESLANAITDGTNTVVYSANASTESADPYQNPQIVDDFGTEEYVVTEQSGVAVPVGHISTYQQAKQTINNPTNQDARPLFRVVNPAQGDTITVNGKTISFVSGHSGEMFIDCETMDAYSSSGTNLNYKISATDFPVLESGDNSVSYSGSGDLYITPRWWEL